MSAIRVSTLDELKEKGQIVTTKGPVPIVVFYDQGQVHAVDNRCPHMGFPLHRGTVQDGILTCHWHHARFDLHSGCTFDLFADDVTAYPAEVRNGTVYVQVQGSTRDPLAYGRQRLQEGMEQNIRLVIAKAVVQLLQAGASIDELARQGSLYGTTHRRAGWGPGLTIMTAMANVADHLNDEQRIAPLYQGLLQVANDTAGQPPKFALQPLDSQTVSLETLERWFRKVVEVRDVDGAERCLLTAIQRGAADGDLAAMLLGAASDHFYLDGGHTVDFINKAFELLDRIGWDQAEIILPSLVRQLCQAQRSEEINAWRHPVDLVELLEGSFARLDHLQAQGGHASWDQPDDFIDELLQDDPQAVIAALEEALGQGAQAVQLAQAVAAAAAHRLVHFHVQNEFADWIGVLHTYTYANAVHQLLKRTTAPHLLRAVFHGAAQVYLDRFLNVPPARLPKSTVVSTNFHGDFLDLLDNQQQVDRAGQWVYSYLAEGGDAQQLFATLAQSLLREDAEFHSFQMLEAAIRQYGELADPEEQRLALVAAARYLAAHAPTQRELLQTLRIALRLHRGEAVFEEE
ncbi:MAG: Rieske 2Fe-2S domain-containing protein [Candidatus Latescibacteria bacterium]|nr:Rieske 2Fe-2S domain-containing protein [Candidatus Latescibacterota bacterium]